MTGQGPPVSVSPSAEVTSDLSDSLLLPTKTESLFCLIVNLKALLFTSGEENIGGLFAEADPGVGGPSTLPGDSGCGWPRDEKDPKCCSLRGGRDKSENLLGSFSTTVSSASKKD